MGITLDAFVKWDGFGPGPGFLLNTKASDFPNWPPSWKSQIPDNSRTRLVSGVPSVLNVPDEDEWKTDISSAEWQVLGKQWIAVAQHILRSDPEFTYYRQSWFVTPSGEWTKPFREHPYFEKLCSLLVRKMERAFAYNRGFIQAVEQVSPRGSELEDGIQNDIPGVALGWGRWVWKAATVVGRGFIPGPGQLIAPSVAIGLYVYNRYRNRDLLDIDEKDEPKDVDVPLAALGELVLPVFQTESDLGLVAFEHPSDPLFKFSDIRGAPVYISNVGVNSYG